MVCQLFRLFKIEFDTTQSKKEENLALRPPGIAKFRLSISIRIKIIDYKYMKSFIFKLKILYILPSLNSQSK